MLYLLRHGQTDWNKAHRLQGRSDIPLNETGRNMAAQAKDEIDKIDLDVCFVSPLMRAVETAQILLEGREIPLIKDDRLMELSFGAYEGTQNFYTDPENPIYNLFHDPVSYVNNGKTESFEELSERTNSFLEEMVVPLVQDDKNILIVAHGALNQSLYNHLYSIPLARFWDNLLKNCEIRPIPAEVVLDKYCL